MSEPSRRRNLSEARTVALILVREHPHLTLVGLSRILKRDVSSLSHCLRRLKERLAYDPQLLSGWMLFGLMWLKGIVFRDLHDLREILWLPSKE